MYACVSVRAFVRARVCEYVCACVHSCVRVYVCLTVQEQQFLQQTHRNTTRAKKVKDVIGPTSFGSEAACSKPCSVSNLASAGQTEVLRATDLSRVWSLWQRERLT